MEYGEKIKKARLERGYTQKDIAEFLKLSDAQISRMEHSVNMPNMEQIIKLSELLGKPVSYFFSDSWIGVDEVDNKNIAYIPVLGQIACGEPIMTTENIECYEPMLKETLPSGNLAFLEAYGDSMSPTIEDGDLVLISIQSEIEDGEICAVLLEGGDRATLKRVKRQGDMILLLSDNSAYDPIIITEESQARIFGKAIQSVRHF